MIHEYVTCFILKHQIIFIIFSIRVRQIWLMNLDPLKAFLFEISINRSWRYSRMENNYYFWRVSKIDLNIPISRSIKIPKVESSIILIIFMSGFIDTIKAGRSSVRLWIKLRITMNVRIVLLGNLWRILLTDHIELISEKLIVYWGGHS